MDLDKEWRRGKGKATKKGWRRGRGLGMGRNGKQRGGKDGEGEWGGGVKWRGLGRDREEEGAEEGELFPRRCMGCYRCVPFTRTDCFSFS